MLYDKKIKPHQDLTINIISCRDGPMISNWGLELIEIFFSNAHSYSIKKLSIKTNTQKSLFLNILRYNQLSTKTKDTNTIAS